MSFSRYNSRQKFKNRLEQFRELFDKRDVNFITQYTTPTFGHINSFNINKIQFFSHTWKVNDKLYKLASEHYNDPTLWWIIAWFNKKPTESHFKIGDQVYIPKPLDEVVKIIGL